MQQYLLTIQYVQFHSKHFVLLNCTAIFCLCCIITSSQAIRFHSHGPACFITLSQIIKIGERQRYVTIFTSHTFCFKVYTVINTRKKSTNMINKAMTFCVVRLRLFIIVLIVPLDSWILAIAYD